MTARSRFATGFVAGLILSTMIIGAAVVQRGFRPAPATVGPQLFDQVFLHVRDRYVDSIAPGDLYEMAAAGVMRELGDPYSVYLDSARLVRVQQSTTGMYGGLGLEFDVRDGWMTVVAAMPNSPAETIGLRPGDRIVQIDDRETRGWTTDEARRALRGEPGSDVKLVVERPGVDGRQSYALERQNVLVRPVQRTMVLNDGIGYVQVRSFSDSAAIELSAALDSLTTAGMTSLILDLRGNPGGLLAQGAAVADLFLDKGQAIVSLRGRGAEGSRVFTDERAQRWPSLRMVVLVDRASASASEIVAGALQDHDRALVLGRPTYGKGSAQSIFSFNNDEGGVKLTTARWYTPSGRSLEFELTPNADPNFAIDDDTLKRPVFKTDAGREVIGGGGIIPDVIRGDSVAPVGPRLLFAAVGAQLPRLRDAITEEAMSLTSRGVVRSYTFVVTPEMRASVRRRLSAKGVLVPDDRWTVGGEWLDRALGNEAVRYALGRGEETRRIVSRDPVVDEARARLKASPTTKELLERAP
jgi:carboxyl-terminal processing protease